LGETHYEVDPNNKHRNPEKQNGVERKKKREQKRGSNEK